MKQPHGSALGAALARLFGGYCTLVTKTKVATRKVDGVASCFQADDTFLL